MRQALMEAKKAFDKSEIPIGAVIVNHDRII
ncbi:MAG: nucleoside deaminase, partial [Dysgonamonadaceae bacterium]